jgi:hypothetical protein
MFDYSLLFGFQFCWGGSVCPEAALVCVPRKWIGEFRVVRGAHCSFCQLMHRQVWSQQQLWEEMAPNFLSAVWHGEAFHGLGVQDVVEFDFG